MSKKTKTMQWLEKNYNGIFLDDWTYKNSPQFLNFANDFKEVLKEELLNESPKLNLIEFNIGYYSFSGYIEKDEQYIYFTTPDLRCKVINFHGVGFSDGGIMIRKAASLADSKGGFNNWTPMVDIASSVERLFERGFVPSKKNLYVRYE